MAIVRLNWEKKPPEVACSGVISIGNFDGVHRGHAALIDQSRRLAKEISAPVVAVTFDPHPLQLLAPDQFQPPLTTIDDRAELLQQIGADVVVILETNPGLLALGAEAFFETILHRGLEVRGIVEGFNFRFGRGREGSNETLRKMCQEIQIPFREVKGFEIDGKPVSSSRVRKAIEEGEVDEAIRLLNRPYQIHGIVVEGAKRGRTIGIPTANLDRVETILPTQGVYAVKVNVNGTWYIGAGNIGPNPTFGENARKIEIHLIDFSGDLYGQKLSVEFLARLRETKKFNSVEELIQQMRADIGLAKEIGSRS